MGAKPCGESPWPPLQRGRRKAARGQSPVGNPPGPLCKGGGARRRGSKALKGRKMLGRRCEPLPTYNPGRPAPSRPNPGRLPLCKGGGAKRRGGKALKGRKRLGRRCEPLPTYTPAGQPPVGQTPVGSPFAKGGRGDSEDPGRKKTTYRQN